MTIIKRKLTLGKYKHPVTLKAEDNKVTWLQSPFALKDEIKSMGGARWNPHESGRGGVWTCDNSPRNWFQIDFMSGKPVYEHFDQPLIHWDHRRLEAVVKRAGRDRGCDWSIMDHQRDMADHALTYHFQLLAGEPGVGKTLAAQMAIEASGKLNWWWVGPKNSLVNIQREFRQFKFPEHIDVKFFSFEQLVKRFKDGYAWTVPDGVVFDESSRLGHWSSQRTQAAAKLSNLIRDSRGLEAFVIAMSGTPSPKSPVNWWSQCEIVWPGFIREGSPKAMERRLAFTTDAKFEAGVFAKRVGWRDDEDKCDQCGVDFEAGDHLGNISHKAEAEDDMNFDAFQVTRHQFTPSKNEVAYLHTRLKGLVNIQLADNCLDLPEVTYHKVKLKPSDSVKRVAAALVKTAPNTITGLTWLRELSDGFQYRDVDVGTVKCSYCPDAAGRVDEWFLEDGVEVKREVDCPRCEGSGQMVKHKREARQVACPKVAALRELLGQNEELGRVVIFAGFTGSVDRCVDTCHKDGWSVVRVDGRGVTITQPDGAVIVCDNWLDFWEDAPQRVAFVAHPESGGMSFTLTAARCVIFYSNVFKPEYRFQSVKRIHRLGQTRGCHVYDLIHLPSDDRVLDVITENRRVELMTLGEF